MGHHPNFFESIAQVVQAQHNAPAGQQLTPDQTWSYFNGTAPAGGYFSPTNNGSAPMNAASQLGSSPQPSMAMSNQIPQSILGALSGNPQNSISSILANH